MERRGITTLLAKSGAKTKEGRHKGIWSGIIIQAIHAIKETA